MSSASPYATSWETYWATAEAEGHASLWDTEPERASAQDWPHFAGLLPAGRPLLDLGCGNGTQTRHLARHHDHVIGADVSAAAIRTARSLDPGRTYLVLDLLDPDAVAALHEKLGDVSIYMRTVLHQIHPDHRPAFAEGLRTLLGADGVLACTELAPAAEPYLHELVERHGPPPGLTRVMATGVRPGSVGRDEVLDLLGAEDFAVLAEADTAIPLSHRLTTGERPEVPAYFVALRRTSARH
ncbi:class I SAM-dependent methyltransferase [Streptomyces sp. YC504]|uniref:Class I SAM-dependent methyltransferase n=1 Tax=Streptomyces mesophilus TaxID=1775132 RepID=A0A6G4XNP4_9ACTN|nr:class I SAM-dependent methyltransferase [Streptomyces mesophilus]NGO78430.1 class I SAM-dependent methyltransferase [Streptomyces mesophilus]